MNYRLLPITCQSNLIEQDYQALCLGESNSLPLRGLGTLGSGWQRHTWLGEPSSSVSVLGGDIDGMALSERWISSTESWEEVRFRLEPLEERKTKADFWSSGGEPLSDTVEKWVLLGEEDLREAFRAFIIVPVEPLQSCLLVFPFWRLSRLSHCGIGSAATYNWGGNGKTRWVNME